jgi:predicted nucleic acid-binding protein
MLIVDASAILYAASSQEAWDRLLTVDDLSAPPIFWSEAVSVLHEARWRGAVSRELTESALKRVLAAPISRQVPQQLYSEAWSIADQLGWAKTYDAEYVALARINDCSLLTADARLRRGAGHLVTIIGPDELPGR